MTFKLASRRFSSPSAAQQAARKPTSLGARAEPGFQGNKPVHAAPRDCRHDEVFAVAPTRRKRRNVSVVDRKRGSCCSVVRRCDRAPPRLRELERLRCCSRAIDFTGHQIMPGLAEHMPFSTGRSLSLSQINSFNYTTPPREINPHASTLLSSSWNEEMLLLLEPG